MCEFDRGAQILGLITPMMRLEALELEASDIGSSFIAIRFDYPNFGPSPKLQNLSFWLITTHPDETRAGYVIADWINFHRAECSINNLELHEMCNPVTVHEYAVKCVTDLGPNLTHLILGYRNEIDEYGQSIFYCLSVTRNNN